MATEAETPNLKPRPRPIVRLGLFLISHSSLVSVVCCVAGVVALLLLPVLAKNTYISENALMPGSASSMLSDHDISEANRLAKDLRSINAEHDAGIKRRRILASYMSELGAEVSHHKFYSHPKQFNPLHFFSIPDSGIERGNFSCESYGVNTVGIIRAPRGDGKESIVLVTPYNYGSNGLADTLSLGLSYAVFSLLTRVTWLAKDIIWLVADSQHGEYAAVDAWLRDYHTSVFSGLRNVNIDSCGKLKDLNGSLGDLAEQSNVADGFRRAGTMAAALVIKAADKSEQFEDGLNIYAEASNGQMPNLDLINIVNYLAAHRQGFRVKVEKVWSLIEAKWIESLGEIFEFVGKVARTLNPDWKFGIPATDYVEGTATLASSLYYQALGIPTGPHGAFRDFQIDAVTLEMSTKVSSIMKGKQNEFLFRGGRLIEGVIRSVNNLLEKFHQSFFLYLLTSPSKFVSVGVYMIAFALLVAPLPLVAASLYLNSMKLKNGSNRKLTSFKASDSDEPVITFKSWAWLEPASEVFVVHLWCAAVSLLPSIIARLPGYSSTGRLVIWVLVSSIGLFGFTSKPLREGWAILKSVTVSAAFIGLLLMSIVNFATAEFGALLVVPMCLMAHPLVLDIRAAKLRNFLRVAFNLVWLFVAFPPTAFFLSKASLQGFDSISVGDFWNWMEPLWAWNSATYIYIGMVHLPCWVLCVRVFIHFDLVGRNEECW